MDSAFSNMMGRCTSPELYKLMGEPYMVLKGTPHMIGGEVLHSGTKIACEIFVSGLSDDEKAYCDVVPEDGRV